MPAGTQPRVQALRVVPRCSDRAHASEPQKSPPKASPFTQNAPRAITEKQFWGLVYRCRDTISISVVFNSLYSLADALSGLVTIHQCNIIQWTREPLATLCSCGPSHPFTTTGTERLSSPTELASSRQETGQNCAPRQKTSRISCPVNAEPLHIPACREMRFPNEST